jgi:hypothetical protein
MAQRKQDIITKLTDRGEDVVGRLSDFPATQRLLQSAGGLKERVDELQRRVRGLDALERRVTALEKKVDQLSGTPKRAAPKRSAAKKPTAKRTTKSQS